MVNPCCSVMSLHKGAVIMAALSIMRAISCFIATSGFLAIYIHSKHALIQFFDENGLDFEFPKLQGSVVIGLTWFMIGVFIFEVPLYSTALWAAYKRNMRLVQLWWKTKCWLLAVASVFGIAAFILSQDKIFIGVVGLLAIIYDFYLIWVLKAYASEMRLNSESKNGSN